MRLETFHDRLQEVALNPEDWATVLHDLSRSVNAVGAILISASHKLPASPVSNDITELLSTYYSQGWNEKDIRFKGYQFALRNGSVTDLDIFTENETSYAPFYQDLLRPYECKWFCAIPFHVAGEQWFLSVQRTPRQGCFQPFEVQKLKALAGSLGEAGNLSSALSYSRVLGMSEAFEHVSQPAIFLDERGSLTHWNASAERALNGVLDFRLRVPHFSYRTAQEQFEKCLNSSSRLWIPNARQRYNNFFISRESGEKLELRITALRGWSKYAFAMSRFMVTVHRLRKDKRNAFEIFRAAFDITRAETRLALSLISGTDLRSYSRQNEISYETARTQLRSIYSKTGLHHQGALINALSKMLNDDI